MRVEQESGRLPGFADLDTSPGRRDVLRVAGASLALAAAGCDIGPEEWGHPLHARARGVPQEDASYATVLDLDGVARGVLVRTRAGHPIKIEGNPDHPGSLGATDVFLESAVLSLHDPERSRHLRRDGLVARQATAAQAIDTLHGEGLRILTGPTTSPSLARLVASVQPEARWHQWAPLDERNARDGATLAFGQAVTPLPDLAAARCVLSLGGGLLDAGPAQLVQARGWAEARRAGTPPTLIVAESTPSLTGLKADRRLALTPHGVEMLARGVAAELGLAVQGAHPEAARIAAALRRAAPAALVQAARDQPPVVHALAHAMNQALGAPVRLLPPSQPEAASLHDLLRDMQAGAVPRLLVLDLDPVRDVPGFAALLARVPASLHAGLHANATALACGWHIPLAHPLESWGDSRAPDGTAAIRQPACAPRVEAALSAEDILAALTGEAGGEAAIRATWLALDDAAWRAALEQGVIAGSAPAPLALQASFEAGSPPVAPPGLTASFAPDPHLWDGRFATEAWLQELPRPITRQAWGSAALIAPADAARLGIVDGGAAEITLRGRSATLPVIVLPGQAQGVVTLPLGSEGAARLRPLDSPWSAEGVTLRPAGRAQVLRIGWLHGEAPRDPPPARHVAPGEAIPPLPPQPSLYPPWVREGRGWGMAIDLDACIGCNACAIACQAENNIPVVGAEEVARGREMHWLRVDLHPDGEGGGTFQPVPCMHCEKAPCEIACPVNATVHDQEGLNVMVYARCIGTRTCSNNCPYKVRRFNWSTYRPAPPRNPDVAQRPRGVIEKCTYCQHRITAARTQAELEGRELRDGEVETACQRACPTQAITFGDVNDPASAVSAAKRQGRHYALLGELGTRPRTTYLARVVGDVP